MTGTSEFVTFLSETKQLHLPTLRFVLRSIVAVGNYDEHFSDDCERLLRLVGPAIHWPEPMRMALSARFAKEIQSHSVNSHDAVSLCKLLLSNPSALWSTYQSEILSTWQREPELIRCAFAETLALLESDALRHHGEHENLAYVAALYKLTPLETEILQYAVTAKQWHGFRNFLKHMPMVSMGAAWDLFAAMVGCAEPKLREAFKPKQTLRSSYLVKLDRAPDHFDEFVNVGPVAYRLFLLHADSRQGLQATFLQPLALSALTTANFPHLADEFNWVVDCLKASAQAHERGVNILIQGPTGVGKTELARLLVQVAGLVGFEVKADPDNTDSANEMAARLERFEWTQAILQTHAGAAVVFEGVNIAADLCELLLKERLDTNAVPTLWVCDESKAMNASVLRRFVYHLKIGNPPASVRRHLASQVTTDLGFEPGKVDAIAADHNLSPAQLSMAARFARLVGGATSASKPKAFLGAIAANQRMTGRASFGLLQSANSFTWDLGALNLETSAPLSRILDGLRRTGCASLAFHGTPGTGKTSLAAYIANTLDRPLLTKRVSDLASKWIGETEKSIANMFQEAAADGSVLLLDEADSFLRDRSLAHSPWEVTQVNELLQQMESFQGVFICATNLIKSLDTAAMRRFTFKIKFLPLDDIHRRRMLATYALSDANADLPPPIGERLAALSQLAPGDFATVRRQEVLIDERFSLESWITELEREHAVRVPVAKRRAAFV